jgi:serine O-acetyltransferase
LAPKIGDHVYIGPGAKVFGDIEIADDVQIGANAVVNKSCMENGAVLVGVPAKII